MYKPVLSMYGNVPLGDRAFSQGMQPSQNSNEQGFSVYNFMLRTSEVPGAEKSGQASQRTGQPGRFGCPKDDIGFVCGGGEFPQTVQVL